MINEPNDGGRTVPGSNSGSGGNTPAPSDVTVKRTRLIAGVIAVAVIVAALVAIFATA